jgi:hypothetical protein
MTISHENITTHVYLEVLIKNNWLDVDATWDSGLKSIFTINQWKGVNNAIAVHIIKKFSLEKSQEIMDNENETEITKDLKLNGEFYKKINIWLESVRNLN